MSRAVMQADVSHQPACYLSVCVRGRHGVHVHDPHGDHDRHDARGGRDVHGGSHGDDGSSAAVRSRQVARNTPVPGACNRPGVVD